MFTLCPRVRGVKGVERGWVWRLFEGAFVRYFVLSVGAFPKRGRAFQDLFWASYSGDSLFYGGSLFLQARGRGIMV